MFLNIYKCNFEILCIFLGNYDVRLSWWPFMDLMEVLALNGNTKVSTKLVYDVKLSFRGEIEPF